MTEDDSMYNPEERDVETRLHDSALPSFESVEDASIAPLDSAPPVYKKEPVFNKKVMLAWAVGAALVWWAVSFVLPIAFESAKTAILQSIKEAEKSGSNIVIERDGQKITITTKQAPPAAKGPVTPTAPVAAPAAPADVASPAKPPAEPQPHRK